MLRIVIGAVLGASLYSGSASALAQTSCGPLKPGCGLAQDASASANTDARLPVNEHEQCLRSSLAAPAAKVFEAVKTCIVLSPQAMSPTQSQQGGVDLRCLTPALVPPGSEAFARVADCLRRGEASRPSASNSAQPSELALDRCMRSTLTLSKDHVRAAVEECLTGTSVPTIRRSDPVDVRAAPGAKATSNSLRSEP
jgi:hypothetical protein